MTDLRRRQIFGWSVLALWALLAAGCLVRVDLQQKISTDVLDLVPEDERSPELSLVRELASELEARTMLLVLAAADGTPAPREAAIRFAQELAGTASFADALALSDAAWREAMARELFELRFVLLFPGWLRENESADLARTAAKNLAAFLERPEALAFQDLVPADPLLLLPDAFARMRGGLAFAEPSHPGLVWAQLSASPLSEAGQAPAFAAIERALAIVRAEFPGLQVDHTGVNRFAAASRARIEREVTWLNALSFVAVLTVAWIFLRGVHRALHLLPVIAFSMATAWVIVTASFDRVHVIVFVLGALLTGVAIDYGFYLYMQPPAGPDEAYGQKVRRLAKPLLASCFTTVAGFGLLLFSSLPLIRQLGVFVGAGLLGALGAAVVYFATVRNPFLAAREFRGGRVLRPVTRRRARLALIALGLAAVPGLARLTWRDDIRELEVPAKELRTEDARIRATFGQRNDRRIYLTHGATLADTRAALHAFERWIGARAELANLAGVVPTDPALQNALRFTREQPDFAAAFRTALEAEGFAAEAFEPFFSAYADYVAQAASRDLEDAVRRLQRALRGPMGLLLHTGRGRNWFVSIASGAPGEAPPPETSTVSASQLQSLNRVFAEYRSSALRLSLVGLAIVGAGVFLTYGVRDGVRIFAIPLGACLGVFGVFGWLGYPLNLFHLLGGFLGVCLTHNYSIFSATSAYRREPPPVSVRLSALTTAASFGVLALSGIPVVRALGMTVAPMVVAALAVIELEYLGPLGKRSNAKD